MLLDELYERTAQKLNMPVETVKKVYEAYWQCVKDHIREIDFFKDPMMTEEEYNKIDTTVSIRRIGRFACNYKRFVHINKNSLKKLDNGRDDIEKSETDV